MNSILFPSWFSNLFVIMWGLTSISFQISLRLHFDFTWISHDFHFGQGWRRPALEAKPLQIIQTCWIPSCSFPIYLLLSLVFLSCDSRNSEILFRRQVRTPQVRWSWCRIGAKFIKFANMSSQDRYRDKVDPSQSVAVLCNAVGKACSLVY